MENYYKINGILDLQNECFRLDKTILEIREAVETSNNTLIPLIVLTGVVEMPGAPAPITFAETLVPGTIYPFDNNWGEDEPQWIPSEVHFYSMYFGNDHWVITEDARLILLEQYIQEYYPVEVGEEEEKP